MALAALVGCNALIGIEDATNLDASNNPGSAPILFVQQGAAQAGSVTLSANVTAGHTLIVAIDYPDTGVTLASISDSLQNTYAVPVGPLHVTTTNPTLVQYLAYATSAASGPDVVTVTLSTGIPMPPEIFVLEYAGLSTDPFDVSSFASGTSASMQSPLATTHFPHELILGYGVAIKATPDPAFSLRSTFDTNVVEDMIVSTVAAYQVKATMTSGAGWGMVMATFAGR